MPLANGLRQGPHRRHAAGANGAAHWPAVEPIRQGRRHAHDPRPRQLHNRGQAATAWGPPCARGGRPPPPLARPCQPRLGTRPPDSAITPFSSRLGVLRERLWAPTAPHLCSWGGWVSRARGDADEILSQTASTLACAASMANRVLAPRQERPAGHARRPLIFWRNRSKPLQACLSCSQGACLSWGLERWKEQGQHGSLPRALPPWGCSVPRSACDERLDWSSG